MNENKSNIERLITIALEEDLGPGDLTTDAIIDRNAYGKAFLITRQDIVLAGTNVFKMVFIKLDKGVVFEELYSEGEKVPKGETIYRLEGSLHAILKGERTALNFLQRMSGIATMTREYVEKIAGTGARILDTRKTAPLLRFLDKYAVPFSFRA